ncbi:MAG: NAD(P)-binding domain-containing protein [Oscillospiraceae bacterium]
MKIGVIGVGIIASYMVTGFCESGEENCFVLSPRNREKSAALGAKYPHLVQIAQDNQEVLDSCEGVILSVLPQNAEEILAPLHFSSHHKVMSVIPILGLPKIRELVGDTAILVDVLPLPFIAKREGPLAIYPPQKEIEELFAPLGEVIAVETAAEMATIRTTTALISPYYELLYSLVEWCGENGLEETKAKAYVTGFFSALTGIAAETKDGKLKELAQEMTPGGLNWQATQQLKSEGNFEGWKRALDAIKTRVEGKSSTR